MPGRSRKRSVFLAVLVLSGLLVSGVASAQTEAVSPPPAAEKHSRWDGRAYELDPLFDAVMIAIPGAMSVGWLFVSELPPAHCAPLCGEDDKDNINSIDRFVAGNWNEDWGTASDIALGVSVIGGVAVLLGDEGFYPALSDLVVVGESIVWTTAWTMLGNYAAKRPRPYEYSDEAPLEKRESGDSSLSFISGHTAIPAAVTTSVFSTVRRRDPEGSLQWWVLGIGTAVTGFVGAGRVEAGMHFPTDILLGAAIGASMGLLVPALHESPVTLMPVVGSDAAGMMASLRF